MKILDFIIKAIFYPGAFLLILTFIPEATKDVKEWKKLLFIKDGDKIKKTKKKTAYNAGATVCANSLSYSQVP